MKVTLESTDKVIEFEIDGVLVPARVWEGRTELGVPCHAYITRLAVREGLNASEFERDLESRPHVPPSPEIARLPTLRQL